MINIIKERQEAEGEQQKNYEGMNPSDLMKSAGKNLPSNMKMPNMRSYSPASFPGIPSSLKL